MSASRLTALLDNGLTPAAVWDALPLCEEWFTSDPGIVTFAIRALFSGELLPRLRSLLGHDLTALDKPLADMLDDLIRTYHRCCHHPG
jgi:hypothetical protein